MDTFEKSQQNNDIPQQSLADNQTQQPTNQSATQTQNDTATANAKTQPVANAENSQVAVNSFYSMQSIQDIAFDDTQSDYFDGISNEDISVGILASDVAFNGKITQSQLEKDALSQNSATVNKASRPQKKFFTVENMAVIGILSAISYVLYLLPHFLPIFKLPLFPSWFDFQISDIPALLGGFAIGPTAGATIILVKCLLKMPFTSTACIGELADIFVGIAFVLPCSIFYKHVKSRKSAVLGMLLGSLCAAIVAFFANRFVLVPFYATMYGNGNYQNGMEILVNAVQTIYKQATVQTFYSFYLWLGVVPFNIIRCVFCTVVTYFIYKPLSKYLHWERKTNSNDIKQ